MADKASPFNFRYQPPWIQLAVSLFIVIIAGTLIFYFLIFTGSLLLGAPFEKMLLLPVGEPDAAGSIIIRYVQASQQVSLFIIPSLIIIYLLKTPGESITGMRSLPRIELILLITVLAISIIPLTTFSGIINSSVKIPEWITGVGEWMKEKEDHASKLTGMLITSTGAGSLVINILILAVIPAFGEELIFRGVLQQLLIRMFKSPNLGVWITAVVFSTIHLQFFGFLPRLILGLSFGYIFLWTRNLWLPIIAHFINNSLPVVLIYFSGDKWLNGKGGNFKLHNSWILLLSLLICILIFYFLKREFKKHGMTEKGCTSGNTEKVIE